MTKGTQSVLKINACFILILIACLFSACAKKSPLPQDSQVKAQPTSIPFATTHAESKRWYKEYLLGVIPESLAKQDAKDYENFARLYFADLSQFSPNEISNDKLAQAESFTHFAQEMLQEFAFIQNQNLVIAPWGLFQSKISLNNNVLSASVVAKISSEINQLEDESYENLNNIILALNLLALTKKYTNQNSTNKITQKITGMTNYVLPDSIYSLLLYRILYAKYVEKFQSSYLLNLMAQQFPDSTISASNEILRTQIKRNDMKTIREYFAFTPFDPTNPLSIAQCRAGNTRYPKQSSCIQTTFMQWLVYLQSSLRRHNSQYVLPIFTDSKLCLLIARDKTIIYPNNKGRFCKNLALTWQDYQKSRKSSRQNLQN